MMNLPPLILASASSRRVELLRQLVLDFRVVVSDAPEIEHDELTARETALVNAYRKARPVAKKFPDALVLAADTLVHLNGAIFGKPASLEQSYEMLQQLQGKTHLVITAVCLLNLRTHRQRIFAESTTVTFKPLDAVAIRRYLATVNPLDKAGGYAIQEGGEQLVERISGSYTNVVGLPIEKLKLELEAWPAIDLAAPGVIPSSGHASRKTRTASGSDPTQLRP
jgi:septum formation protein